MPQRGLDLTREAFARTRTRARLGAGAGAGGPARRRVRRRRRVPLPARGRGEPALVERAPGAPRLRGALDGLPGRGGPARPGRGPLRDPQGRPRADVRLPRGGLRARADRAGAARAAGDGVASPECARPSSGPCAATRATGRPTTATPTRRACACVARFSLSDRARYYWPVPEVQEAVARLFANLDEQRLPLGLREPVPGRRRRARPRPALAADRRPASRASTSGACSPATPGPAGLAGARVAAGARLPL